MDPYSSGEELVIKTRKPYTITKQRERWTEEEHNRFLEALKLHGRAWQRIEEHIGTKTAVQIRSHAQKFFTKLEKEALVKGVPVRQALDIEIPPPRPKRKPSNPYPRKTSAGSSCLQLAAKDGKSVMSLSSLHCVKDVLNLEKEPIPEKSGGDEKVGNVSKDQDEENCTEPFSFLQDASSGSLSLANKISTSKSAAAISSCSFREFVPILGEVSIQDQTNESFITMEPRGNQKLDKHDKEQAVEDNATFNTSNFGKSHPFHGHLAQDHNPDKLTQSGAFSVKDIQAVQNYPRHVPVHIVDGSLGSAQNISSEISYQEQEYQQMENSFGQTNLFGHQPGFTTTTEHRRNASRLSTDQIFPTFHPLMTPVRGNQDDYRSLLNISSTFSSFIVSALLQYPAAHAAASFAATFWPCANMEASSAESGTGGIPLPLGQSAPSIAAIAAATIAAATSWWAAHGLLPSCPPPFHQGFTCPPPSVFATPPLDTSQPIGGENTSTPEAVMRETNMDANTKVSLQQQSASKSPALASSEDSEGSRERKLNTASGAADAEQAAELALLDSSKAKIRKQVDRSSCGSNTASSSDIETDALEKNETAKEELKEADASPSSDSSGRRSRSYISLNDSWKEVSEEGRLAFRALFSREVLPQSFSPPQDPNSEVQQKSNMEEHGQHNLIQKIESASHVELNRQLWTTCSSQQPVETSSITSVRGDQNGEESMLSIGLGQVKLKVHRTGFKPYKRSSVEAKESRMACTRGQNEEKGHKRMRLGGEAST